MTIEDRLDPTGKLYASVRALGSRTGRHPGYGANRNIRDTYAVVPSGFTEDTATQADLIAAGFDRPDHGEDKPGQQPLSEMIVPGKQMITPDVSAQILRQLVVHVLRDPEGEIVATWDEGRWWTPAESRAFVAEIVAEIVAEMRAAA